jgi:hypothetical protein
MNFPIPEIQLDSQALTPIAAAVLGTPITPLKGWKIESIAGSLDPSNRLLRVSGEAVTAEDAQGKDPQPWSVVLKISYTTPTSEKDPQDIRFVNREALAYKSGLLAGLPCGLSAPRCYAVDDHGPETWLWLEELRDDTQKPWSINELSAVARLLGCFNGVYLSGHPLPDYPWLSQGWLRRYVEAATPIVQLLPELRQKPLFQRSFPATSNEVFLEAWGRRHAFLDAIESLPQTFCHQDAFAGNLFWQASEDGLGHLVGIDWAYSGIAALGSELAPLVAMSSFGTNGMDLFEACLEGYLAGLKDSGYEAVPDQVRFSLAATLYYRYIFGAVLGEMWAMLKDESNHAPIAAAFGMPDISVLADTVSAGGEFYKALYAQASSLLENF